MNNINCKLCPAVFKEPLPILGESSQQKTTRMMEPLIKHIQQSHPEHLRDTIQMSGEFTGVLSLTAFDIKDQHLSKVMELAKAAVMESLEHGTATVRKKQQAVAG